MGTREWTAEETLELALLLHSGLMHLASYDEDRARKENEVGFNARDTEFGHRLAGSDPHGWSPKMIEIAFKMARTYSRTQLRGLGIDWSRPYVATEAATEAWRKGSNPAIARVVLGKNSRGEEGMVFEFTYSAAHVASLKAARAWFMPERTTRGAGAVSAWWAALDNVAAQELAQSEGWDMSNGLMLKIAGAVSKALARAKTQAHQAPQDLCFTGLEALRPFQVEGATWLVRQGRAILGDDMGTGKTLQVLAAAQAAGAWPLLVICPAVVKLNWAKEVFKWLPGRSVSVLGVKRASCVLDGEARAIECGNMNADVVVVNYDIVGKLREALGAKAWGAVVCDESHYLKTHNALRTKHVTWLMTGYDKDLKRRTKDAVPYRWLLSGTPMLNRPIELVSQLTIIDRLQELGGFRGFVSEYCDAKHNGFAWDYSGAKNMAALGVAMKRIMLRRTKAEVLPELPPKSREYLSVGLANEAEYRRAEGAVAKWIGECHAKDAEFMEGLYAKAAEAGLEGEDYDAFMAKGIEARERSATKRAERAEALVRFTALKRLAAKGKLPAVIEWVQDWLESNEGRKLVIFGHHVETVRELAAAFGSRAIEGATSAQDRQAAVDEFQTDPSVRVIVANIQAGGVGITLTAASDVLFVEQHWNPGTHDQAEDRVNRLGQSRACVAYYMIAEGTIDEEIASMIEGKRAIVAEGTGDEGALKTLSTWVSGRGGKA